MTRIAILGLALLVAVPAFAGAPATGTYYSWDLPGGSFDAGRFSEGWVSGQGQVGNTVNAMSWNGMALGLEWVVSCPAIASPPTQVLDTRDGSGTGDVVYVTVYGGGSFWFSKDGPWGDGSEDYSGSLNTFNVTSTHQYFNGALTGIRSNITLTGAFDGYDSCMEYAIGNAAFVGFPPATLPSDYPPFLDSSCNTGTLTLGAWGDAVQIEMNIYGSCTVPNDSKTWGAVKALFAD